VVVEVFVSHCDGEDPLCQQRPDIVGDLGRLARIADAIDDRVDEADAFIDFSQECGPGVGCQVSAVEICLDCFSFEA